MVARSRLDTGPASEMRAESFLGFRRLKGSNWTGLPQPKPTNKSMRVPRGSKCTSGFRDIRPMSRGVGSPSLSAK